MLPMDYYRGMHKHFIINQAARFLDENYLVMHRQIRIDLVKFDDWLHKQLGDYKGSIKMVIKTNYGDDAAKFIEELI